MSRPPSRHAFTLIEMITVIAIIAILAGLVLSINSLVQRKAATARTETEIKTLITGCEAYKADNGGYPQTTATDTLDPVASVNPSNYANASLDLYKALSGDTNANGTIDVAEASNKNYAPDFFKPARLEGTRVNGVVTVVQYLRDPFGNSYGYSTAGLKAEQDYRVSLTTNASATRASAGYNGSTFDLWSTGGQSTNNGVAKWIKNW